MIIVNGYEFPVEQLEYLLYRVYWKQTSDVNLNTVDGCKEAAKVTARLLGDIGEEYHPGATETDKGK